MSVEERRAWVAARDPEKVRAADRARYKRDKEKRLAAMAEYRTRRPEIFRAANKRWREKNPEKVAANTKVNNAVRDGRLTRQPCEVCGKAAAEAHHDDYSKPLEVRWLCKEHHEEQHHNGAT